MSFQSADIQRSAVTENNEAAVAGPIIVTKYQELLAFSSGLHAMHLPDLCPCIFKSADRHCDVRHRGELDEDFTAAFRHPSHQPYYVRTAFFDEEDLAAGIGAPCRVYENDVRGECFQFVPDGGILAGGMVDDMDIVPAEKFEVLFSRCCTGWGYFIVKY